ncbi:MAG: hypothetical protein WCI50_11485 [Actinomycetes bacterium]
MNSTEVGTITSSQPEPSTSYEPPAVVARGPVGDSLIGYGGGLSDPPPPSPAWSVRRSGT